MITKFMRGWAAEIALGLGLVCIIVGSALAIVKTETAQIQKEIQELRGELTARGEFLARLQKQVDFANSKATWLLNKIDKRRVLIPVLHGDVYKLVEIEASQEETSSNKLKKKEKSRERTNLSAN